MAQVVERKVMKSQIIVITILLMLTTTICSAEIRYWGNDLNYPVWDMGNRGGSVFDLSSAYSDEDTIIVDSHSVKLGSPEIGKKATQVRFRKEGEGLYIKIGDREERLVEYTSMNSIKWEVYELLLNVVDN